MQSTCSIFKIFSTNDYGKIFSKCHNTENTNKQLLEYISVTKIYLYIHDIRDIFMKKLVSCR